MPDAVEIREVSWRHGVQLAARVTSKDRCSVGKVSTKHVPSLARIGQMEGDLAAGASSCRMRRHMSLDGIVSSNNTASDEVAKPWENSLNEKAW